MTHDRALAVAASCWCTSSTEDTPFDADLAAAFAAALMGEVNRVLPEVLDIDARIEALTVELATLKATRKLQLKEEKHGQHLLLGNRLSHRNGSDRCVHPGRKPPQPAPVINKEK